METRKEQKEKRKQQILMASLDLFIKKGYAATKISDIAEMSNMSVGLLFHYFESKEKLYEELIQMGLEGTKYPISHTYEKPIMYFEEFTKQLFNYMKKQPYIAKMFMLMSQAQRNEATPENIRCTALKVNIIDEFIPIIEKGQKDGTIRNGNPRALSNAFWCSIQGVSEQYAIDQTVELPEPKWIVDIIRGENKQ